MKMYRCDQPRLRPFPQPTPQIHHTLLCLAWRQYRTIKAGRRLAARGERLIGENAYRRFRRFCAFLERVSYEQHQELANTFKP